MSDPEKNHGVAYVLDGGPSNDEKMAMLLVFKDYVSPRNFSHTLYFGIVDILNGIIPYSIIDNFTIKEIEAMINCGWKKKDD